MVAKGKFGPHLRDLRVSKDMTLREFCERAGVDAGNYSRIERGLFAPPSAETIRKYAEALDVAIGSDEHTEMLDLAAVDRGQLPSDLLRDEQVVEELPAFFRLLRQRAIDADQVRNLVEVIRRRP